jgi:hypothetical protein
LPVRLRCVAAIFLARTPRRNADATGLLAAMASDRRHPMAARLGCRARLAVLPLLIRLP